MAVNTDHYGTKDTSVLTYVLWIVSNYLYNEVIFPPGINLVNEVLTPCFSDMKRLSPNYAFMTTKGSSDLNLPKYLG